MGFNRSLSMTSVRCHEDPLCRTTRVLSIARQVRDESGCGFSEQIALKPSHGFNLESIPAAPTPRSMPTRDRLKTWARRIKRDGLTLWFAGKHPRTPWHAKALGVFVVAYALSPIDLIPDFIPVLGYLDDVLLLPGLIWLAIKLLPPDVLRECRNQADAWIQAKREKPRSRVGAVVIVALWVAVVTAVGYWLWR